MLCVSYTSSQPWCAVMHMSTLKMLPYPMVRMRCGICYDLVQGQYAHIFTVGSEWPYFTEMVATTGRGIYTHAFTCKCMASEPDPRKIEKEGLVKMVWKCTLCPV